MHESQYEENFLNKLFLAFPDVVSLSNTTGCPRTPQDSRLALNLLPLSELILLPYLELVC